ncbi:MAG: sigma-54-dependent Fis family transcriptional regulator [Nitrospirae bacterium]|nr:sigma-54-dependent Fis family transcriptional regulator [Nitrospirota bacterium]
MIRILIVEDKASMARMLRQVFKAKGYDVTVASDGLEAKTKIQSSDFHLVITDLKMPNGDGMEVLKAAKAKSAGTIVLMMTAFGTIENAVEAMRQGAFDYLLKPFSISEIELKAEKALEQQRLLAENEYLKETIRMQFGRLIGSSPAMQQVYDLIQKVAPSTAPVLILGESGTGKELVAHAIHDTSPRAGRPFIAVNCGVLSEGLIESELFGHEKGAFTGAVVQKKGRFELADGGTLFLDEIGELSPAVQVKLLRVLQEGEYERVGGHQTLRTDVRVIAATHRDLAKAIEAKSFREDLYYRINVLAIKAPPLRERPEDIPVLAAHFLQKASETMHKPVTFAPEMMALLSRYAWPGNVRELENVVERAVVLTDGPVIRAVDLPKEISGLSQEAAQALGDSNLSLDSKMERLEREVIRQTLERVGWNQTQAAKILGVKRSSLQYKMKRYGLER